MRIEIARRRATAPPTAPASARNCRAAHAPPRRRSSRSAASSRASPVSSPRRSGPLSRILRLTSWSEVSTPAELSMASVLMRPPLSAYSTRPSCVAPRLAPSPTTFARTSSPLMRTASLARSPTSRLVCARGLDEGADAAEPQKIDIGLQQRLDQFVRRQPCRLASPISALHLRRQRDFLRRAREDAAALGDQRFVVIGPARARQVEHALAFRPSSFPMSGVGIEEDVAVIEGGHELRLLRQQHAVAEHVARHVADADDR